MTTNHERPSRIRLLICIGIIAAELQRSILSSMNSQVRQDTHCLACWFPRRWCICDAALPIINPIKVDVLMHFRESNRPSSTGKLIGRLVSNADVHVWRKERRLSVSEVQKPDRELVILHPCGQLHETLPSPEKTQVVLLDGSWRETTVMAHATTCWGVNMSLPMAGRSRFWLRAQQDESRFSTAEALARFYELNDDLESAKSLRLQLDLHVFAGLLSRGRVKLAHSFLDSSDLLTHFQPIVKRLMKKTKRDVST